MYNVYSFSPSSHFAPCIIHHRFHPISRFDKSSDIWVIFTILSKMSYPGGFTPSLSLPDTGNEVGEVMGRVSQLSFWSIPSCLHQHKLAIWVTHALWPFYPGQSLNDQWTSPKMSRQNQTQGV